MPRNSVTLSDLLGRISINLPPSKMDAVLKKLTKLEEQMSGLTESVDALKGAVDGVAQRLLPQVEALEAALSATQDKLAKALEDDAEAASVLADSNAATAAIRTEVDRLNALGAEPETPVETDPTDPVEPPVVDEPSTPVEDTPAPADETPVLEPEIDPSIPGDVEQRVEDETGETR